MPPRDRRLAQVLVGDPEVTRRWIQQGTCSVRHQGPRIGDRNHEFDQNLGRMAR